MLHSRQYGSQTKKSGIDILHATVGHIGYSNDSITVPLPRIIGVGTQADVGNHIPGNGEQHKWATMTKAIPILG